MGGSDRTVLIVVPLVALALGFWLLVIGPKRSDSADLQTQIDGLNASISAAEAQVASAEAARDQFPKTYAKLVTLGRAVPEDGDQATFINDMANIGKSNNVQFRDFALTGGVDPAAAPPAGGPPPPAADPAGGDTRGRAGSGRGGPRPGCSQPRRRPRACRWAPRSAAPVCRWSPTTSASSAASSTWPTSSTTSIRASSSATRAASRR